MPTALTKAQTEQLKLLRGAAEGTLPKTISQDRTEFSYDALLELCEAGMMTAGEFKPISGPRNFMYPKMALAGRQFLAELEQLSVLDHARESATVRILAKLKDLHRERSSVSPFSNHIEFLAWADKAEPLLAFNAQLLK